MTNKPNDKNSRGTKSSEKKLPVSQVKSPKRDVADASSLIIPPASDTAGIEIKRDRIEIKRTRAPAKAGEVL